MVKTIVIYFISNENSHMLDAIFPIKAKLRQERSLSVSKIKCVFYILNQWVIDEIICIKAKPSR